MEKKQKGGQFKQNGELCLTQLNKTKITVDNVKIGNG